MAEYQPSKSLYKYGPVQRIFMVVNLMVGSLIWGLAATLRGPLADFCTELLIRVPEVWAIPLSLGAALHLVGQVINGDRRLPPWITPLWRLVGAMMCFIALGLFLVTALQTSNDIFKIAHVTQSLILGGIGAWVVTLGASDFWNSLR